MEISVSGGRIILFKEYPLKKKIRVLIVDDHPIVRKGLRALLESRDDMQVAAEAADGQQAIDLFNNIKPDVVLMDLIMPEVDGLEAIRRITSEHPDSKILVLSSAVTDEQVYPAIREGALGYLDKDTEPGELIESILRVFRSQPSLQPDLARRMLGDFEQRKESSQEKEQLTEREMEVLRLLARGYDNPEIAKRLFIAEVTVRTHISRIMTKLHLANRVQATLYALREGISNLDTE